MYWIDTSDQGRLMSPDRQIPFWADYASDIQNLPHIHTKGVQQGEDTVSCLPVGAGASCTCIENSTIYVLTSYDEWKPL